MLIELDELIFHFQDSRGFQEELMDGFLSLILFDIKHHGSHAGINSKGI